MIKWYCFRKLVSGDFTYRYYIPEALCRNEVFDFSHAPELLVGRLRVAVVRWHDVYAVYGLSKHATSDFSTAREAFEAGEKAFASNYPELYLQTVVSEVGRKRD